MSLYALIACNDVFSKAAALSPSIVFNEEELTQLLKETHLDRNTTLYMDFGSEEFGYEGFMRRQYRRFCSKLMKKDLSHTAHCAQWRA